MGSWLRVAYHRVMNEPRPIPPAPGVLSGKALFAVAVWGVSFVATRVALEGLTPFGLVAMRFVMGAVLLASVLALRRRPVLPASADGPACAALGVLIAVHLLVQAYGLMYTSAIHTGWIIGFIPVTIALAAHVLGRQRLIKSGWAGVAVATAGVLVVTMQSPPDFRHARFGDLLQLSTCLTWTAYTLLAAKPVARCGALRVTLAAFVGAAVISLAAVSVTGWRSGPINARVVVALLFLGFVCSGLGYVFWVQGQHEKGPTSVGALLYFEPFFTLAAAIVVLDEPVMLNAVIGGVVVLAGVWLATNGSRRPPPSYAGREPRA